MNLQEAIHCSTEWTRSLAALLSDVADTTFRESQLKDLASIGICSTDAQLVQKWGNKSYWLLRVVENSDRGGFSFQVTR